MEMQKLKLTISINASKEKIWDVLLQDKTYRIWTSAFHPGSYAEGDWKEGSKMYFKTPEGDGMVSQVLMHRPGEIISFEHQAVLANGKVDDQNEEAQKWKGATETYRLEENEGGVVLMIDQDITPEYAEWFTETWKKALDKVKALAEE